MYKSQKRTYRSSHAADCVEAFDLWVFAQKLFLWQPILLYLPLKQLDDEQQLDLPVIEYHPCEHNRTGAIQEHVTYLIDVRADDDDGCLGGVAGDGAEPEVEAGVLVAQANVPQQQVHGSIRQEKLQHKKELCVKRHPHNTVHVACA